MLFQKILKIIGTCITGRRLPANGLEGVKLTGTGKSIFVTGSLDSPYRSLISIGDHVTIAHSTLLTHDAMGNNHDGYVKVGKIIIEDYVSVGFDSIILPGVRIGRGSIVSAGSVVVSGTDIPEEEVWGGCPAKFICKLEDYFRRRERRFDISRKRIKELGLRRRVGATYMVEDLERLEPLEIIYLDDTSEYAVQKQQYLKSEDCLHLDSATSQ